MIKPFDYGLAVPRLQQLGIEYPTVRKDEPET